MRTGKRKGIVDNASMIATIFVLLMSAATSLFANEKQPIVGSYTVPHGYTLWKIAGRAYPGHADWKKVGLIVNANPGRIANPKHIEAGWKIIIPPVPSQPRRSAAIVDDHSDTSATTTQTQSAPAAMQRIIPSETKVLPEPTTAVALPDSPVTPLDVLYGPSPRVLLKNTIGYRLVLPVRVAIASKIPLKGNFDSRIYLYESELDKERGWFTGVINHINTRAQRKNTEVTLSFALRQLPSKPFLVVVAGNNIDGATFASQTQPFTGKFPGPRGGTRMFFAMGRTSIPYAIACGITVSPIPIFIGLGHMGIPTVMSLIMRHSADKLEAKAEAKLQKGLAENRKLLNGIEMPRGIMPITSTTQLPGGGLQ